MKAELPRVSIGMPVYNDEKFLRHALNSLLAQDFRDYELIISDNASTDGTEDICQEYAGRDPRIRYHRNPTNVGASANFNQVFRLSSGGEYFMWAGGHDLWAPTYLSRCVSLLDGDRSIVLCNSGALYMSQDGKEFPGVIRQIDTRRYGRFVGANLVLWQASTFLCYCVMRSSALRQTRLMLSDSCATDLILGFELSLLGGFAVVPETLFFMRDNRGEHATPKDRAQRARSNAAFRQRLFPGPNAPKVGLLRSLFPVDGLNAVRRSPLPWPLRIGLMGCVMATMSIGFYSHLPGSLRRTIRSVLNRISARSLEQR